MTWNNNDLEYQSSLIRRNAQVDPNYPAWFENHKAGIDVLAKQTDTYFEYRPEFSIIVPLFKTPEQFFTDMVDSVKHQSYGRRVLVLVNASLEDARLAELVADARKSDKRIKAVTLTENNGISENTNAGIAVAAGDFISFFDHDDVLEPDILFEYAKAINENPSTDVLYCDEDKLMLDGELAQPLFKPCFNIDLLRDNNYICHMLTVRKSLLDTLEPNTREYDGAQDHNLALRAAEKARHIHHVSKVLYHWRISETSTAADTGSKPYATQAGIRSVQEHLDRMGIPAKVSQSRRPFTYRIDYAVPSDNPLVSIIIPNKDHHRVLDTCVQSILNLSTYRNF